MIRFILAAILIVTIAGCASTKTTSFTDPAFEGEQYNSFVVNIFNADFQSQEMIASKTCEALVTAGAECTSALEVFPPTRSFSNEKKARILEERDIDGYLLIFIGDGSASSQYIGSQQFGTVDVYGNYATVNTSSSANYSYSRQEGYDLMLIDTETRDKAWVGGARTSGQGLANVTDTAFASSLARSVVEALEKDGHL